MQDDPYADALLYDLEYANYNEDVAYYVALVGRPSVRTLELGCGTGRLTIPIARAGGRVDGLDLSQTMLQGLAEKLTRESAVVRARIRHFEADFREPPPELEGGYDWVLWPFNAIHHCRGPEDVLQTLTRAKALLGEGGRLALDLYLPDLELYDRDPNKTYEHRVFSDPRTGQPLHTWERGWWDAEAHVHHVVYTYRHRDGREDHAHLRLRMFEAPQLLGLIEKAGFRVDHSAEDFVGNPKRPKSLKWVLQLSPT